MKSLFFFIVFFLTVTISSATNSPVKKSLNNQETKLNTITTELAINTKGVKKLEDINVVDFHKNTYLKLMLKVKSAKKIC